MAQLQGKIPEDLAEGGSDGRVDAPLVTARLVRLHTHLQTDIRLISTSKITKNKRKVICDKYVTELVKVYKIKAMYLKVCIYFLTFLESFLLSLFNFFNF